MTDKEKDYYIPDVKKPKDISSEFINQQNGFGGITS